MHFSMKLCFLVLFTMASTSMAAETTMFFLSPAVNFTTTLLLGNGRLGANHYGGIVNDKWGLNEDSIWSGSPYDQANKGCASRIGIARAMMNESEWTAAQNYLDSNCMGIPEPQTIFQPAGFLNLNFTGLNSASNYRRQLDLSTAVETTSFSSNSISYNRTSFISYPDQVLVVHLTASQRAAHSLSISMTTPMPNMKSSTSFVGNNTYDYILTANSTAGPSPVPAGLSYENRMRVILSGGNSSTSTSSFGDPTIKLSNADEVLILISIASTFVKYDNISGDPSSKNTATINALGTPSVSLFPGLQSLHIASHQPIFNRFSIDLGENTTASSLPLDQRLLDVQHGQGGDPGLWALYVNFGRYLLISSSRGGAQPANLQGVWNEDMNAEWGSKFTTNINLEMNYWGAETANLQDMTEPLFRLAEDIAVTGARTAVEMYGTTSTAIGTGGGPGAGALPWVMHHNTDQWRATAPTDAAFYGFWPTGGAWTLQTLWEHYLFDPSNTTFVERVYPLFRGSAQFFLETLQQHPNVTDLLVTNPTMSPEHQFIEGTSNTIGTTMDSSILRDIFDQTTTFAKILDVDSSFISSVQAARARLPPFKIGSSGQLQEWFYDWDLSAPDIQFTHISHMYALYPSSQIDPRINSTLANACATSLELRGPGTAGWPIAWRIATWSRLLNASMAQTEANLLMSNIGVWPNMMGKNTIFQIDSNLGGMATMLEMYLQSHNGEIHLLPALPSMTPSGFIKGIRARGGFTVSVSWSSSALISATITSTGGSNPTVRYGSKAKVFAVANGGSVTITHSSF